MVKRKTGSPLYKQLIETLLEKIQNGTWQVGTQIPTEEELSKEYHLSRITVRNAIAELVEKDLLIRKQGVGTFVCKPRIKKKLEYHISFTETCAMNGLEARSRLLFKEIINPTNEERKQLVLTESDKLIHIQRIRYGGDEPLLIENNYLSYSRFNDLLAEDLNGSFYDLLNTKYSIQVKSINLSSPDIFGTSLEVIRAPQPLAELLQVDNGAPLVYLCSLLHDQYNNPIHIGRHYMVAERYKFVLQ